MPSDEVEKRLVARAAAIASGKLQSMCVPPYAEVTAYLLGSVDVCVTKEVDDLLRAAAAVRPNVLGVAGVWDNVLSVVNEQGAIRYGRKALRMMKDDADFGTATRCYAPVNVRIDSGKRSYEKLNVLFAEGRAHELLVTIEVDHSAGG